MKLAIMARQAMSREVVAELKELFPGLMEGGGALSWPVLCREQIITRLKGKAQALQGKSLEGTGKLDWMGRFVGVAQLCYDQNCLGRALVWMLLKQHLHPCSVV